jgi:predicted RNA polymerase sigma factor
MNSSASGASAVTQALHAIMRDDRGRLLSALIARIRDFQLAEDALQDGMVSVVTRRHRTGLAHAPEFGLRMIEDLENELAAYQPYHAAWAEFLVRTGKREDTLAAYDEAVALGASEADVRFLIKRRAAAACGIF